MLGAQTQTVLVVEDEQKINRAYQRLLRNAGYRVLATFDGAEALQVAAKNTPGLILLDLYMPRMGGLEFLRRFVREDALPKIVIVSNYDDESEIKEAYRLGADHFILKKWASPQGLLQIVKNSLNEH